MNLKKLLSYFLAFAICATVLSISLYASVGLRDDTAPTTATVAVGGNLTYSVDSIKSWFMTVPETSSGTEYKDYYISDTVTISASPEPNGSYTSNINSTPGEFVFTPTLTDVGKTFVFSFNVKGGSNDPIDFPGSDASNTLTVTVTAYKENTPAATVDIINRKLTGLTAGEFYIIESDSFQADFQGEVDIQSDWFGRAISIAKAGNGSTTVESEPQILLISEPVYSEPSYYPPAIPEVTLVYEVIENMEAKVFLNQSGSVDSEKTRLEVLRAARTKGVTQITIILPENCKGISTKAIQKLVKAAGDKKLFLTYDDKTVRLTSRSKQILTLAYYDSLKTRLSRPS
jgi:hypothetical protein